MIMIVEDLHLLEDNNQHHRHHLLQRIHVMILHLHRFLVSIVETVEIVEDEEDHQLLHLIIVDRVEIDMVLVTAVEEEDEVVMEIAGEVQEAAMAVEEEDTVEEEEDLDLQLENEETVVDPDPPPINEMIVEIVVRHLLQDQDQDHLILPDHQVTPEEKDEEEEVLHHLMIVKEEGLHLDQLHLLVLLILVDQDLLHDLVLLFVLIMEEVRVLRKNKIARILMILLQLPSPT
jgi:hypothetical protein